MAETKGLVHKAVALSGNTTVTIDKNYSSSLGKFILKEAGLKPSEMNKLQEMPWLDYIALANRAAAKYNEQNGGNGMMRAPGTGAGGDADDKPSFDEDVPVGNAVPFVLVLLFVYVVILKRNKYEKV